uniref:Uncharacterized protein n=1 Tax=Cacopsylla melanoneura TaxID=428564 RepID=A0A8D8Y0E3_9HEMI
MYETRIKCGRHIKYLLTSRFTQFLASLGGLSFNHEVAGSILVPELHRRAVVSIIIAKFTSNKIAWAANSSDLSASDYFLWGYLKNKVYIMQKPRTLDELKEVIVQKIQAIHLKMLENCKFYKRN